MNIARGIKRRVYRAALVVTGLALVTCLTLYLRRGTVVIATFGKADIYAHHSYQVLNPFRDRKPEQAATTFFLGLLNNCAGTLVNIHETPNRVEDTCSREHNYPLKSWQLRGWKDDGDSAVVLRYKVSRIRDSASHGTSEGPYWVWLKNEGGEWHVKGYETWY